MLIGEAPGADEDRTGLPFVGKAGQVLEKILEQAQLNLNDNIYVTNIVKCRPPNNRDPELDEVRACADWLEQQIKAVAPKVIVTVGRIASQCLLGGYFQRITKSRGKVFNAYYSGIQCKIVPVFHPAYLLYNQNERAWNQTVNDFILVREIAFNEK